MNTSQPNDQSTNFRSDVMDARNCVRVYKTILSHNNHTPTFF